MQVCDEHGYRLKNKAGVQGVEAIAEMAATTADMGRKLEAFDPTGGGYEYMFNDDWDVDRLRSKARSASQNAARSKMELDRITAYRDDMLEDRADVDSAIGKAIGLCDDLIAMYGKDIKAHKAAAKKYSSMADEKAKAARKLTIEGRLEALETAVLGESAQQAEVVVKPRKTHV